MLDFLANFDKLHPVLQVAAALGVIIGAALMVQRGLRASADAPPEHQLTREARIADMELRNDLQEVIAEVREAFRLEIKAVEERASTSRGVAFQRIEVLDSRVREVEIDIAGLKARRTAR